MRKENSSFLTKFISEAGSYLSNADYFAFVELKDYACYVIADGIDSDDLKKSAELAVTAAIARFSDMPGMSKSKLKAYLNEAHRTLIMESAEIRLEASIMVIVTDYKRIRWGYAGNCRLHLIHNGQIVMATKDTSLTQRMADNEEIPLDMISSHEERNNLYSYLGMPDKFSPVISSKRLLEDGDILLLQTRGAWENIGEAELLDATEGTSKPEEVCTGLEDVILSQRLTLIENYTIAAIFVDKIYKNPKKGKYTKFIKLGIGIASALLVVLIMAFVVKAISTNKKLDKLDEIKAQGIERIDDYKYEEAKKKLEEYESVGLKAKPGSKNYNRIQSTKLYYDYAYAISDMLYEYNNKSYDNARSALEKAVEAVSELEFLGEDVKQYKSDNKVFDNYANHMNDAADHLKNNEYQEAATDFGKAARGVSDFQESSLKVLAETAKENAEEDAKSSARDSCVSEGDRHYKKAKDARDNGDLETARKEANSAKNSYQLAKDNGYAEADSKIAEVEIFQADIGESEKGEQESSDYDEANDLFNQAQDAANEGNTKEAINLYKQCRVIFEKLGPDYSDKVTEVNNRINELSNPDKRQEAYEDVYTAFEFFEVGDYQRARDYLKAAKKIWKDLGEVEEENKVNNWIQFVEKVKKSLELTENAKG